MSRTESIHSINQRKKSMHSKRKESVSSDVLSESESYYDSFLQIKKEVPNCILIEKKFYEKLIQYIQKTNTFNQMLKNQSNKPNTKKVEYSQSLINTFSIISTPKPINKEEKEKENSKNNEIKTNNENDNLNKNNDNEKININNENKNNENNKNNIVNTNQNNQNTNTSINNKINNNVKVNPNSSMMSLFMNAQKEKAKEKEQIIQLKLEIEEMTKKHETEIENYKEIIKEFSNKIDSLQKELKKIKEINEKYIQKENSNKQKIQIVFSHPKILTTIISYLDIKEKLDLSKCNSYLYKNIYFRAVTEKIYKKYKIRENFFEKFEKDNLATQLEIKENQILELFQKYITEQKVSGKEMRNEIVKSLIFLEKYVKIPMNNFKGPMSMQVSNINDTNDQKKGKFLKFFSAITSEIKEEIGFIKNDNILNNNYISFNQNELTNISESDKHVLETFQTDKSLNIKFEYQSSNKIKDIINDFFASQLPQPSYQTFIQKICETFCDLLYSSFVALNDIKNLQIIVFALYGRYMRYKLKIEDLQSEIEDLNHFADSNRQIKEMLTKTKNELEFKYTNSIMTISQLNNVLIEKEKEINNVKLNSKEKEEKYEKFKNEIVNEYKKIKDDFNFTKNQRDSLKNILIELKNYFVKVVTGELLK